MSVTAASAPNDSPSGSGTASTGSADERLARRVAVLLAERRRQTGASVRRLARASGGRFTARRLRAIEAGKVTMTVAETQDVAELYGIDLRIVASDRMPLEIDPRGVLSTGGSAISFEPDDVESLLTNYLRLVRSLRGQERPQAIELRRNDVEVLAQYLEQPGELVVERLAGLMGATQLQRRVLAGMFVAGAMVIGLSAVAAANLQAAEEAGSTGETRRPAATASDTPSGDGAAAGGADGSGASRSPGVDSSDWRD